MTLESENPYQAPSSVVEENIAKPISREDIMRIMSGQKLVIYSLIVSFGSGALNRIETGFYGNIFLLAFGIGVLTMGVVGVLRVTSGLRYSTLARVGYVIGLFIPLANLVVLFMLSSRATKRLRDLGYEVGFFGAKVSKL